MLLSTFDLGELELPFPVPSPSCLDIQRNTDTHVGNLGNLNPQNISTTFMGKGGILVMGEVSEVFHYDTYA